MLKLLEATILLILSLVFTSIILNETKEEKEIRRFLNRIVFIIYIITIVFILTCSITTSAKEGTKQVNEIVIEL